MLALLFLLLMISAAVSLAGGKWRAVAAAVPDLVLWGWITVSVWYRSGWVRRAQPTWWRSAAALVVLFPGGLQWYLRRNAHEDGIAVMQSICLAMSVAVVLFASVLAHIGNLANGPVIPSLPIIIAVALINPATDRHLAKALDFSSSEKLKSTYRSLFMVRVAFATSAALSAFCLTFITGPGWIYYIGGVLTLALLWTRVAPTGAVLARDQRILNSKGCELSLGKVLHGADLDAP